MIRDYYSYKKKLGKEGCDLDEFNAHRFLERLDETKTVKQMRDELREIDMDFNKRMAIVEYLLWRYGHSVSGCPFSHSNKKTEEKAQFSRKGNDILIVSCLWRGFVNDLFC